MFQVPRICCGRCGNGHVMASPAVRFRFLVCVRCEMSSEKSIHAHVWNCMVREAGGICRTEHCTCDWKIGHRMFLTYWHSHLCDEKQKTMVFLWCQPGLDIFSILQNVLCSEPSYPTKQEKEGACSILSSKWVVDLHQHFWASMKVNS